MGRRSLDATKVRFNWCARATVAFLRGRWLAAVAVAFLCVEALDLWVVPDLGALVADEDFFLVVEVPSWAMDTPHGNSCKTARRLATKRNQVLTLCSLARFARLGRAQFVTKHIPIDDIQRHRGYVQ